MFIFYNFIFAGVELWDQHPTFEKTDLIELVCDGTVEVAAAAYRVVLVGKEMGLAGVELWDLNTTWEARSGLVDCSCSAQGIRREWIA